MADLTEAQAAQSVKIAGANPSTGAEDSFMEVDSSGNAQTINNNGSGASAVNIQDGGNSITVDAVSLPLPTGAATSALQTAGNASLASIDAGIPSALGQTTMSASMPVVVASDQSAIPVTFTSLDLIASTSLGTLNAAAVVSTQGRGVISFAISGTWSGIISFEATVDGSNWISVYGISAPNRLNLNSTASNDNVLIDCAGYSSVRARMSAYTSGSATVATDASVQINNFDPTHGNNNQTIPTQSQLVGGSDGTNIVPLAVDSLGRLITSSLTGFGADFSFGEVTTAATTRVLVKRTAYNEQTSNGQRSIASSSANDTAAGTGARTLQITYLDSTGAGPFVEVLTLNGTARVNTVATNIRFVEHIQILTAGSAGVNAGIITLYTVPTSGGTAIGTIAVGNNQTFWAHHYIPASKTCNITGISCGHNGTTVGSGALFTLNAKSLTLANGVESQISDFVRLYGQTSTFARAYTSPITVLGPTRLQMYVTPETSSSTIYRGAFDFFEP